MRKKEKKRKRRNWEKGEKEEKGEKGEKEEKGEKREKGEKGGKGEKEEIGQKGEKGEKGKLFLFKRRRKKGVFSQRNHPPTCIVGLSVHSSRSSSLYNLICTRKVDSIRYSAKLEHYYSFHHVTLWGSHEQF